MWKGTAKDPGQGLATCHLPQRTIKGQLSHDFWLQDYMGNLVQGPGARRVTYPLSLSASGCLEAEFCLCENDEKMEIQKG